jgi:hypothetical protein
MDKLDKGMIYIHGGVTSGQNFGIGYYPILNYDMLIIREQTDLLEEAYLPKLLNDRNSFKNIVNELRCKKVVNEWEASNLFKFCLYKTIEVLGKSSEDIAEVLTFMERLRLLENGHKYNIKVNNDIVDHNPIQRNYGSMIEALIEMLDILIGIKEQAK